MNGSWRKYPDERILVGIDWAAALDGAAIDGDPDIEIVGDGTLTLEYASTIGDVTSFWLGGGDQRFAWHRAHVKIATSEGENLSLTVPVQVMPS